MDTHEPRVYCFFIPPKHIKATSCQLEWLNISIKHYLIISMLFEHKLKKYFILYVLNPATSYLHQLNSPQRGGEKAYKDTAYIN
jgi:hypothetical protein